MTKSRPRPRRYPVFLCAVFLHCGCSGGAKDPIPPDTTPEPTVTTAPDPTPTTAPEPEPAPTFKPGPDGFPLPLDADDGAPAPGGGGEIIVFNIPRGKAAVDTELRATFEAEGWTIDSEETSPRGATRMNVSKGGKTFNVRLTGDDAQSALILTLP